MDFSSLSLVNFLLVQLTFLIVVLGGLLTTFEKHLPAFIAQTFRYGKHAYKGKAVSFVTTLECPKSWFKHFYVFALLWATLAYYFVINLYVNGEKVPDYVVKFLDLTCSVNRESRTTPITTLIASTLVILQCWRRFYETQYVQVFSTTMKIHLSQYFVGYIHYFCTVLIVISQAEGFTRNSAVVPELKLDISVSTIFWVASFLYAWYHQYQSNLILANMRKDKKGAVISQKHTVPKGGHFEMLSSPHMFFEMAMYISLYAILDGNTSAVYMLLWVLSNQSMNSYLTHQWYKDNFKDYPRKRKAIIPFLF